MKKQQIKSFEHACEVLGIGADLSKFNVLDIPQKDIQPLADYYQITKIVEATNKLNEWEANWGDSRQYKYNPYFYIKADASKPSGFGFSDTAYDSWGADTSVGSRLLVGSSEEALYIGETFAALFESVYLIAKTIQPAA